MTVLTQPDYDKSYFMQNDQSVVRPHKAGYTNYKELNENYVQERKIKKFLTRHNIPKTAKILELGCATGFMGKIATEEGYTNWTCIDWSDWAKTNEAYPIIKQDALSYLQAQVDNSYDYIITRALIECIPTNELVTYAIEAKRIAVKQIHTTYIESNTQYYTVKTISEWLTAFLNDPDIIVEDYRKDG